MNWRKVRFYHWAVWIFLFLPVFLYLSAPPELASVGGRFGGGGLIPLWSTLSQVTGLLALTALSLSFVLSSRFKPLELRLGGLDKMYRLHHRLGITAFVLIILHPLLFAIRFIPERWGHFVSFWGPFHRDLSMNIAVFAFWLFIILILLTLIRKFPYNWWKQTHRLMGLVLVGAAWHMLTIPETPGRPVAHWSNATLHYYLLIMVIAGVTAYLYKWIWIPLVREKYRYQITGINRMPSGIMTVQMNPTGKPMSYQPGQFAFARFEQNNLSDEQHPFTICSPPGIETANMTVKVLGDFTKKLYENLEEGTRVRLEGPYGQFNYREGSRRQLWLAGGIGVTPFVCWLHDMRIKKLSDIEVDFYYCVHNREETIYQSEIEKWSRELPGVRFHLVCTGEEGRLKADRIAWDENNPPEVYLCGPVQFIRDLRAQLNRRGIREGMIHYEEFEFR